MYDVNVIAKSDIQRDCGGAELTLFRRPDGLVAAHVDIHGYETAITDFLPAGQIFARIVDRYASAGDAETLESLRESLLVVSLLEELRSDDDGPLAAAQDAARGLRDGVFRAICNVVLDVDDE